MDSAMVYSSFIEATTKTTISLFDTESAASTAAAALQRATTTVGSIIFAANEDDVDGDSPISMNNFYPALVQCFGIIICGYIAGRFNIISNSETIGLNTFVGTFALPSLIFLSLVELNWNAVNWTFLLAILISKTIVFFAVLIISMLVARPMNYARSGLFAIFCTQSNDFAIGYPIVLALYQDLHPEYASYLYLMAPISLAILNPIGLVLLEISKIMASKREVQPQPICPAEQLAKQRRCLGERSILVWNTIKSLFFNPMLLMTLLGVGGGFLFPKGLPEIVAGVLRVFGQSFSATALFLLGLKIVGGNSQGGRSKRSAGLLLPAVLILVKILVLPLVSRQTVNLMQAGEDFNDTTELSTFSFLYGTFPAAPGAFVIASQYNVEVELIARSMVLCTFISAPLMFISAKMISLTNLKPLDYLHELDAFSFDISIAGVAACVWMLTLLVVSKRFKRMPQRITCCLVISQLMCCIGVILWCKLEHVDSWPLYVQFLLYNIGTYSTRLWTAILAITLLFLQCRSLCFVLKMWPYMLTIAWGVPTLISALLIAFDENIMIDDKHNPSFQYGNVQAAVAVFMIVMCFIVTVGCLVLHQRYKKRFERYMTYARELSSPESEISDLQSTISTSNLLSNAADNAAVQGRFNASYSLDDDEIISSTTVATIETTNGGGGAGAGGGGGGCSGNGTGNGNCCSVSTVSTPTHAPTTVIDIEDLLSRNAAAAVSTSPKINPTPLSVAAAAAQQQYDIGNNHNSAVSSRPAMCSSAYDCGPGTSRQNCQNAVEHYADQSRDGLEPLEFTSESDEQQTLQHTILLIILLCSMFVGLSVSVWTLVMDGMSGIYLELSFLDVFLNYGQSLIVLAVFITDTGELLMPLVKIWRKAWYGANVLSLPLWSNLSTETKHICEQFRNHHLDNCKKDIAKDRRWRIRVYRKVFYGSEFVDWLIEVGLSKDRLEAVHYARHLIDGRVLRHINNVYHFEDKKLLYNFCTRV